MSDETTTQDTANFIRETILQADKLAHDLMTDPKWSARAEALHSALHDASYAFEHGTLPLGDDAWSDALRFQTKSPAVSGRELLSCPFCGNERPSMKRLDAVWCGSCLAEMPEHDPDVPNAVQRWNTRLAPAPEKGVREDTAWLIEHENSNSPPLYWTGESWGKWSYDHSRACRFARREDAFKVSLAVGDTPRSHRVVEHAWSDAR